MHNHELHPQNFSAQNINDETESIIQKLLDSDVLPIQIRKFLFTNSADASWAKLMKYRHKIISYKKIR